MPAWHFSTTWHRYSKCAKINTRINSKPKTMKKLYLLISILILCTLIVSEKAIAGVAFPDPVKITQKDGTVITVVLQGDERIKWAKTLDGYTLLYNSKGIYEYAILDASGNLIPSGLKAHDVAERTSAETSFLANTSKGLFFSRSQISVMQQISNINMLQDGVTAFPTTGDRKLLCILIGFTDLAFTETQENFDNLFNQLGYGTYGSVKDYYKENSYGQFNLTVDVAGPYTASNTQAYYGANNASGDDVRPKTLVTEAVILADPDVNYNDYDNDGNSIVDGIYVIYAGYNEAEGGGADCIWYHAWNIPVIFLDGVAVSSYSCSAEYKGSTGSNISGIGNICHEFGHVMGAPDFYDTDYGDGGQYEGTGTWDVMASGNFNLGRDCPAHYNPYVKGYLFGWTAIHLISTQQELTLLNSAMNKDEIYRYNTTTLLEYFLIENKQQLGFDLGIPGHGLIVYHVHSGITGSDINITHPQKYDPVCSDAGTDPSGTAASYGVIDSQQPTFPGSGNNTFFTDATLPSSKSWAGSNTQKDLAFISENTGDNTVFLCFMGCPPVADFEADELGPCTSHVVDFTDLSEYATSWSWSFSPSTVSYFGGTSSSSQNPRVKFNEGGDYTVTLTVSNDYGTDAETKTNYIHVYTPPEVTLHPVDVAAEWGDDVTFTASATGDPTPTVQWKQSTDGGSTYEDMPGETSETLSFSCVTLDMSGNKYFAIFANMCGDDWTNVATLTVVPKSVSGTVTVIPNPQQYSDMVDITVDIPTGYTCGEMAATGANIYIGTQFMGTVTFSPSGSDLTATLEDVLLLEPTPFGTDPTGQMAPGPHTVTAYLLSVNPNFSITDPTTTLDINQEDARAYYTGAFYASTQGVNSSDAIITLSATIKDITAVDPGADPYAGDIRNATLSFVDRDASTTIVSGVPIGLVDPNDPTVAVGTWDWETTISGDAEDFTIGVVVGNYYIRNSSEDDIIVTVAKPLPNFVTGGGYIVLENPAGAVAGDVGSKNNFGFNVRFNQQGTNLRGKVSTIIRRTEWDGVHTYRIKGNSIKSLAVIPDDEGGEATINCKASIEDITDPLNPVSIDGNASLQINMTDNGEPGDEDLIAITIWDKKGGLWYASNWDGTYTVQQLLDGGNLAVHGDGSFKALSIVNDKNEGGDLRIAPNPNNGQFTLMLSADIRPGCHAWVVDMRGMVMHDIQLVSNETNIDLGGAPKGLYQVIVFNSGDIYREKIVIK